MVDDGGSAFPRPKMATDYDQDMPQGMSLRDWFAGQALTGVIADCVNETTFQPDVIAKRAYAVAEALLKAR